MITSLADRFLIWKTVPSYLNIPQVLQCGVTNSICNERFLTCSTIGAEMGQNWQADLRWSNQVAGRCYLADCKFWLYPPFPPGCHYSPSTHSANLGLWTLCNKPVSIAANVKADWPPLCISKANPWIQTRKHINAKACIQVDNQSWITFIDKPRKARNKRRMDVQSSLSSDATSSWVNVLIW